VFANINNIPVQVITVVDTTGDMTPLRFRYEAEDHSLQTVNIEKTISRQDCNYVGQQCVKYVCKAVKDEREVLFEMKYLIASHKWVLSKILN